jgi:hypothetical protein
MRMEGHLQEKDPPAKTDKLRAATNCITNVNVNIEIDTCRDGELFLSVQVVPDIILATGWSTDTAVGFVQALPPSVDVA